MDALAALLPSGMEPWVALLLIVASCFTSAITAAFGIGGGIAMLALMGLFVPVASLIPVHGAVQLGSNTGRAWHQRAFVRMDIAKPFIAGSVVGAIFGVFLVVQLPDALLKLVLGGFIIALTWAKIPGIDRLGKAGLAVASVALALLSMLVGATGPLVAVLFARFLENDRKALIATSAVAMTTQHLLKIVVFGLAGFAFWEWVPLVAAMILSGFIGTVYGTSAARTHAGRDVPQMVPDRDNRAGARPFAARRDGALTPDVERRQADRADDQPPPGEQRKTVSRDVVEQIANDDHRHDKGSDEADADDRQVGCRQDIAVLVEVVGECAGHGRHGEEEGELRRRALVGAHQQRADDCRARARSARNERQALEQPDLQAERQRELHHVADTSA